MGVGRRVELRELAERIRAIEERHDVTAANRYINETAKERIPTGWTQIDAALAGGLTAGGLHEWFGVEEAVGRRWTPPLCILVHLAWRALDRCPSSPWTVWIGKYCHPYPRVVIRGEDRRLLDRSLFVAPRDAATRLWAIDLALRSPAVGCVVADGSGFDRPATQRIQLLGRTQTKAVFSTCPSRQQSELSAAQTRWRVCVASLAEKKASGIQPGWSVELLRCKGMRPTREHRVWLLEWNRAEGAVHLSARLAGLAGSPQVPNRRVAPIRRQQRTA
jgi:protein ImuA